MGAAVIILGIGILALMWVSSQFWTALRELSHRVTELEHAELGHAQLVSNVRNKQEAQAVLLAEIKQRNQGVGESG